MHIMFVFFYTPPILTVIAIIIGNHFFYLISRIRYFSIFKNNKKSIQQFSNLRKLNKREAHSFYFLGQITKKTIGCFKRAVCAFLKGLILTWYLVTFRMHSGGGVYIPADTFI